jgi:hypothetical protein
LTYNIKCLQLLLDVPIRYLDDDGRGNEELDSDSLGNQRRFGDLASEGEISIEGGGEGKNIVGQQQAGEEAAAAAAAVAGAAAAAAQFPQFLRFRSEIDR